MQDWWVWWGQAELAAIEQEIRDQHGATLTSDQVVKIMQAAVWGYLLWGVGVAAPAPHFALCLSSHREAERDEFKNEIRLFFWKVMYV